MRTTAIQYTGEKELEIDFDNLQGWCSCWKEGIDRFPALWTNNCKIHDIMGYLSDYGEKCGVRLYGCLYTWQNMGFTQPLTQEQQDTWLLQSILDIAEHAPQLTNLERDEVRRNACIMYLGLRSIFSKIYRAVI